MTSLLAACRKHFAATRSLHAGAKPVCLGAAPAPRLKCTLWQSIPPCYTLLGRTKLRRRALSRFLGSYRNYLVYLRPTHRVKKPQGMRICRKKGITPLFSKNKGKVSFHKTTKRRHLSLSEVFHHPNVTIHGICIKSEVATVRRKSTDEAHRTSLLLPEDVRITLHIHTQVNGSSLHEARNK